jgi:hypothetical protein
MESSEKSVKVCGVKLKQQDSAKPNKKHYAAPSLKSLGRLNTVTLGGSPGRGDSGNVNNPYDPDFS